jgi:hypothetical protein
VSATDTLIGAAAGLVAGLVPFGYTVRKDRRERQEREKEDAAKKHEHEQQELERKRERLTAAATRYLDLLGKAMALLEAVLVDADNADELLHSATGAHGELQGHAQSELFMDFQASPPVIWSDKACRTLLRKGLELANDARSQRQTGDAARKTQYELRELTLESIDRGGPRDLFRWASTEAIQRYPKTLPTFNEKHPEAEIARRVAEELNLEPPP